MPITRNTLIIMEAYARSYESPDSLQLPLITEIRRICKGAIQLLELGGVPAITEEELINKCNQLKR